MKKIKLTLFLLCTALLAWHCTSEQEPIPDDCAQNSPVLAVDSKVDANCNQADGSITLASTITGQDITITVNGTPQTGPNIENLAAGSYLIVATTSGGCSTELTVEVLNADGVNATASTSESDCDNPDGNITITATGGVGPYEYKLDDNAFQAGASFSGLAPGEYEITVRDASGCEVVLQERVDSDVRFSQISSIIETNCAVPSCHGGSRSPDLTTMSAIQSQAARIQVRTGARTMPPNGSGFSLTDAEIEAIACWVADGAPGN